MMRTLRKTLIAGLAGLGLLSALMGGGMMLMRASAADGDVPSATTVPESELEQLSMENGTIVYTTGTGTKTVQFKPTAESGDDYSLANATDLAIRFKVLNRQSNRPNSGSGLSWVRIKFAESDTVWGVTKEDLRFTFVDAADDEVGTVRISNGGNNAVGGQLNVSVRTDGTVYIPLTQIRDGNQPDALGNRLTDTAGYQDLTVEYIEFTYSAHRWNWAFGDIALIRQAENTVTTDVLDLTPEAVTAGQELYDVWYDNVKLVVNGTEATETADGTYEVDLGAQGKVRIPSGKVFAYDPVLLTSDLADGYGITKVSTSAEGKTIPQRGEEADNLSTGGYNKDRSALLTGYTYEGEYFLRRGNHGLQTSGADDTADLGTAPLNGTIEVTVSPLVALNVTGEADGVDIYYFRLGTMAKFDCVSALNDWTDMPDDGSDGTLWLKPNEEAAVLVIPKAGYDFTGVKLNGSDLTAAETKADKTSGRVAAAIYKVAVGEEVDFEVLGVGDQVELALDLPAEGGSVSVDGTVLTGTTLESNIYKTLSIDAAPEKGYKATVSIVYPAAEEGGEERVVTLEPASDGKYYYQVDGVFTLRVAFDVVSYTLTYRLNNGTYAEGESNPETITYFDTVTLKSVSRDGYDFMGWRIEGQSGYVTELKSVESDLTLIAVFEMASVDPGDDPGTTPEEPSQPSDENGNQGLIIGLSVAAAVVVIAAVVAVVIVIRKKKGKN